MKLETLGNIFIKFKSQDKNVLTIWQTFMNANSLAAAIRDK